MQNGAGLRKIEKSARRIGLAALFAALGLWGLLAGAAGAYAQASRLYFAGYMGLSIPSDHRFNESATGTTGEIKGKNSFSFAGALGLRFDDHWRIEGEVSYRNHDLTSLSLGGGAPAPAQNTGGGLSTTLYLANLYYDFDFEWQNLYPYLSAGAGIAAHGMDLSGAPGGLPDASDTSIGFAWQLGGGLKYRLSQNAAFTGGYRYVGTTSLETDTYDVNYGGHEIRFGIEYDIPPTLFK